MPDLDVSQFSPPLPRSDEILDVIGGACVVLDSDWKIIYANAEAARLAGEPVEALLGRDHWEKWPILRGSEIESAYRSVAEKNEPVHLEHEFRTPDGLVSVWLEIRAYPRAEGGVNVFFRDITDRKQTELKAAGDLTRETLIKQIAEAGVRGEEAQSVLDATVAALAAALGLDRCYYVIHDTIRHVGAITSDWRRPGLEPLAGDYVLADYTQDFASFYRLGRAQIVDDCGDPAGASTTPLPKALLDRLGLTAFVRVPMSSGSSVTALVAGMTSGQRNWRTEEVALVQAVAAETVEVIKSLQIQQRHRRIATVLQEALQPSAQQIPDLEVAAYLKPALGEANVGGDFYDLFGIGGDRYAIVIGDVSGKGLEAAAQVSVLRNMLRTLLYQGAGPADAASDLNRIVVSNELLTGFATIFVGVYDRPSHVLRYTSCGHEHPLILRDRNLAGSASDCECVEGKTCGPPVGVTADIRYAEEEEPLGVGDILVLYTDGLSEACPDRSRLLGIDGLIDIVKRNIRPSGWDDDRNARAKSLTIAGNVMSEVLAFADGRLRDDACLIVIQRTDSSSLDERDYSRVDRGQSEMSTSPLPAADVLPVLNGLVTDQPAQDQLRLLVDNVTEYAIFLLDVKGNVVTWNRGAERIQGYAASEIIGKHFSTFYMPEDVVRGHPLDELSIAASEGRYEEEGWRVRKDGTRFWANVVITALFDSHGNLCGYGKVTRDFSTRRQTEEQLRRSEERFRLLVQGVRDYAIFMLDANGYVASWNEGARHIKGYAASEIVGKHFSTFYTPEDIARNHPAHELALAKENGRYEEEGWRVRKDGARFRANVLITALRDEHGAHYGFAKITRDVTERYAAEEALARDMREQISRSLLRDVLYSVTEGRLRFCESDDQLPEPYPCRIEGRPLIPTGLADLRRDVVDIADLACLSPTRVVDLVTAASEAALNAVVHGANAEYSICGKREGLQVWVVDRGRGIELNKLHRATLERGYTTENSLGHGFWLMLNTVDRIWLRSTPAGTTVVLEQDAIPPEPDWLARPRDLSDYLDILNKSAS